MRVTEEMKQEYISWVYEEMERRGIPKAEIPKVIAKTGFMKVMKDWPEEQLHYQPESAVNEILLVAARH